MALKIISADERIAHANARGSVLVVGGFKTGKTSLLRTLPEGATLFLDFESGGKSVTDWRGDAIEIRDFIDAVDITCLVGGIDPSSGPNDMFSAKHYERCKQMYPEIAAKMDTYKYVFFDSISRLSFAAAKHAMQQPESYTVKGQYDGRGMYGLLAKNLLTVLTHLQHAKKNTIFIGLLEDVEDDFGRHTWRIQLEGAKVGRELPGIVDQVVTLAVFNVNEATGEFLLDPNGKYRGLVCQKVNPWGFPAGTRSPGLVDLVEEPHLGKLIEKLNLKKKGS